MKNVSWYFHQNLKPQGPLTFEEIRQRIHRGEIGPQSLVSNTVEDRWKPAKEWGVFEDSLFPALQGQELEQINLEEKSWVLLVPSAEGKGILQEGPFSLMELKQGIREGRISVQQFIWKSGLSGWCKIQDRPEFDRELVQSIL